jgi:hypothetical protein
MPFSHGNQAVFSIDATEGGALTSISTYVSNVHYTAERDISELKRIGGTATARLVGTVTSTYTLEGFYDPTVNVMFTLAVAAASPVTRSIEYGPAGSTTGLPRQQAEVYIASYEVESDGENPNTWSAELVVDGAVTFGTY